MNYLQKKLFFLYSTIQIVSEKVILLNVTLQSWKLQNFSIIWVVLLVSIDGIWGDENYHS